MSSSREDIIERIKKLLALATSNNPEEAASAMAMAQDLLERHRISMLELEGNNEEVHTDNNIFYTGRLQTWRRVIFNGITKLVGCHLFVVSNYNKTKSWYITGRDSDISYARFLTAYIMVELTRIVNTYYSLYDRNYKESWLLGAATGVLVKMKESQTKVFSENLSSTALIKLNNRYAEAEAYADADVC